MATIPEFPPDQVRPLRKALHLTQTGLAAELGVTHPLISQWENGQGRPRGPAAILLYQLRARAEAQAAAETTAG